MAQQNPTKNTFQRVSVMCNKQQEGSSFRKIVMAHDDWLNDVICRAMFTVKNIEQSGNQNFEPNTPGRQRNTADQIPIPKTCNCWPMG